MNSTVRLQQDENHFEYIDAEITLKIKVYTEQEDIHPYISEKDAIDRVKNHLLDLANDVIIPEEFAEPINIKIL